MRRNSTLRLISTTIVLVLALLPAACAAPWTPQAHIHGKVYADAMKANAGGHVSQVGIAATVQCNGTSAKAGGDGAYDLSTDLASDYECTASAGADYQSGHAVLQSSAGKDLTLDFGPIAGSECDNSAALIHTICSSLHLLPGGLSGAVHANGSGAAVAGATVTCWNFDLAQQLKEAFRGTASVTTNASGSYSFSGLQPGPYACYAGKDFTLHRTVVSPRATATLALQVCTRGCLVVTNETTEGAGPLVMHSFTAYLDFWLPAGHTFEPGGNDARYESLMAQYFKDIGSSAFYNVVTQYWDYQGTIGNSVTLGGSYVDTTAYPVDGSKAHPLYNTDLQASANRVIQKNGWILGPNAEIFVFTAYGIQECDLQICSFAGNSQEAFAAWHGQYTFPNDTFYAYIGEAFAGGYRPVSPSPSSDPIADAVIDVVSHEHFETVTDPLGYRGWYDHHQQEGEVGDLCAWDQVGHTRPDGSTVTLNNGHSYFVQPEWSNATNGCAYAYSG